MAPPSALSTRIYTAFWIFGLTNNVFWVIILSAALDLVGPAVPKATVLLVSVTPALGAKIITPYVMHRFPYGVRIITLVTLCSLGTLTVASSQLRSGTAKISATLAGIALGSIAGGIGEVNFLSMGHHYGSWSLSGWSSGTGGAGLVGASAYALVTTTFGWSVRSALLTSLIFPAVMLLSYLLLLPAVSLDEHGKASSGDYQRLRAEDGEEEYDSDGSTGRHTPGSSALLQQSTTSEGPAFSAYARSTTDSRSLTWAGFRNQLATTKKLVVPYMIPLFLVYFAEYVINQGVTPTLLFPLDESPFTEYRAFYPMYAALYQTGVFISRSSLPFVRIRKSLYLPSLVQVGILAMLTLHAMYPFLPSVYVVFVIILIEGLIGGLVYVSAFADIREEVPVEEREFSLGVVALADSVGILCAGVVGAALETGLCGWQIKHGRDWCHRT